MEKSCAQFIVTLYAAEKKLLSITCMMLSIPMAITPSFFKKIKKTLECLSRNSFAKIKKFKTNFHYFLDLPDFFQFHELDILDFIFDFIYYMIFFFYISDILDILYFFAFLKHIKGLIYFLPHTPVLFRTCCPPPGLIGYNVSLT